MPNLARIYYYLLRALGRLHWDREMLDNYKNKQLRSVIRYGFENVRFYHEIFKASGLRPTDIRTMNDLNKLPVVRKGEMRKYSKEDLVSKKFSCDQLKTLRTGGSTGQPFQVYICGREDDWRKAIYLRANISCGQRPRDRWIAVDVAERGADTSYFQRVVRVFERRVIPVTWDRASQLKAIADLNPDVLDGFSGVLWLLAKEAELRGVDTIRPRIIFGSGDLIDKSSREYMEKVFGVPYYDQFGCTEVDRTAWQCPERVGYHIDMDSVIMQFVDEDGEEVAPGERGEIVYTSLFNYAMPFIRYGTMDMGVPIDEECLCGRNLPLMKVVEGRSNSFLTFPDGHVVAPMSFIETLGAFRLVNEIDQYRVFQKSKNLIEIYVKKTSDEVNEEKVRSWLIANLLNGLPKVEKVDLSGVTFEVKFIDELPMSGRGKLNVVVSHVPAFT
jgi:phenylacetate-CoA ligase